jgi:hypothetical protein
MRKLLLAAAAAFAVQACSSSDNTASSMPANVLLRSVDRTDASGTVTTTYHYDGSKLVSTESTAGLTWQYTYTGDQITSVEGYDSGVHRYHLAFSYANGKVVEAIRDQFDTGQHSRTTFTYVNAVTITGQEFTTHDPAEEELLFDDVYTLDGDGEITTLKESSNGEVLDTYTYTHDMSHNPYVNITGYNALMQMHGINHNTLSQTLEMSTGQGWQFTTAYTYNADGYPLTSSTESTAGIPPYTLTYHYQ